MARKHDLENLVGGKPELTAVNSEQPAQPAKPERLSSKGAVVGAMSKALAQMASDRNVVEIDAGLLRDSPLQGPPRRRPCRRRRALGIDP